MSDWNYNFTFTRYTMALNQNGSERSSLRSSLRAQYNQCIRQFLIKIFLWNMETPLRRRCERFVFELADTRFPLAYEIAPINSAYITTATVLKGLIEILQVISWTCRELGAAFITSTGRSRAIVVLFVEHVGPTRHITLCPFATRHPLHLHSIINTINYSGAQLFTTPPTNSG
jgi:hypothetical protein